MAKISLTKSELAALDALIADLQDDSTAQEVDVPAQALFIGAIAKTIAKTVGIAAKTTPMIMQLAGRMKTSSTQSDEGMSEVMSDDGQTLSVDRLIELRKSFS